MIRLDNSVQGKTAPSYLKQFVSHYDNTILDADASNLSKVLEACGEIYNKNKSGGLTVRVDLGGGDRVIAAVLWHPARMFVLDCLLESLKANSVNALFYTSNLGNLIKNKQRVAIAQVAGCIEMEHIFLGSDYDYIWHIHSDINPPPFAKRRLLEDGKDIITAVVPKASGNSSYLLYYDDKVECHSERSPYQFPHYYIYHLVEPPNLRLNPGARILPQDRRLVEVEGSGFGCLLMSKCAVRDAGYNIFNDFLGHWPDGYWGWNVYHNTPYQIYVDTTVRCRHLCHPLCNARMEQQKIVLNRHLDKDWYGWVFRK